MFKSYDLPSTTDAVVDNAVEILNYELQKPVKVRLFSKQGSKEYRTKLQILQQLDMEKLNSMKDAVIKKFPNGVVSTHNL